jgi:osmotically-inducible protein OsmY
MNVLKAMSPALFAFLSAVLIALPAFGQYPAAEPTAKERAQRASGEAKQGASNAALTAKVKTALAGDVGLKTLKIDVDSDNGRVTLKGRVDSADTKRRVETVAQKIDGVRTVQNQLVVEPSSGAGSSARGER